MTPEQIEQASLGAIIAGFNKQSTGMPRIMLRFLELKGEFSQKEIDEATRLSAKILKNILEGKKLTVAQLAAVNIVAELTLQVSAAIDQSQKLPANKEDIIGYG